MTGLQLFTLVHVLISLVGIVSGFVVVWGLQENRTLCRWTSVFLSTTVMTSVTGFMFPFEGFKPSYVLAVISLIVLAIAIFARYKRKLAGGWRKTYAVLAVVALYLNFFVLIAQSFMKVPFLHSLAPTQSEGPFVAAQAFALLLFTLLAILAALRFKDKPPT
jgi:hypothetical protein